MLILVNQLKKLITTEELKELETKYLIANY